MMTCSAAVNKNIQLTSSETTSDLTALRCVYFSNEMFDSFSRTCNNQHASANAKQKIVMVVVVSSCPA